MKTGWSQTIHSRCGIFAVTVSLAKPQTDLSPPSPLRTHSDTSEVAVTAARLPTQDELPYSDGEPLESERHALAMQLLIRSLKPWLQERHERGEGAGYVGGDMFLYFSAEQVMNRSFRGPDVFIALGVKAGERKSWVVWEEGKAPDVVIELLSDSTRKTDINSKPRVYRDEVGVREYYWFDPFHLADFAGFAFSENRPDSQTVDGDHAQADDGDNAMVPNLRPDGDGRITSEVLGLRLGPWTGCYDGVTADWLRWYTLSGELLLTVDERANERARRAEEKAQREARRADKMAEKLRELGLEPDGIL